MENYVIHSRMSATEKEIMSILARNNFVVMPARVFDILASYHGRSWAIEVKGAQLHFYRKIHLMQIKYAPAFGWKRLLVFKRAKVWYVHNRLDLIDLKVKASKKKLVRVSTPNVKPRISECYNNSPNWTIWCPFLDKNCLKIPDALCPRQQCVPLTKWIEDIKSETKPRPERDIRLYC